jgi:uncharacterized membrane protein (DUF485 family)
MESNFITDRKSKIFPIIGIALIIFFIFIAILSFASIYLGRPLIEESGKGEQGAGEAPGG